MNFRRSSFSRGGRWRPRSRSPVSRSERKRPRTSKSPSPAKRKKIGDIDPRKIKIILPIGPNAKILDKGSIWQTGCKGIVEMHKSLLSSCKGQQTEGFKGAESVPMKDKALRKIQIEIRRNIPDYLVSDAPIRRDIWDSANTVVLVRRSDEGLKPIFDRDDMKADEAVTRRIIKMDDDKRDRRFRTRTRSRSPIARRSKSQNKLYSDSQPGSKGVKDRLGVHKGLVDKSRDVRSRLGRRRRQDDGGDDKVLGKEELESQRPASVVQPWEVNPQFVPRGRGYFEHDDREDHGGPVRNGFRERGGGHRVGRGGFRNRPVGGGSPEWKHDKFQAVADVERK